MSRDDDDSVDPILLRRRRRQERANRRMILGAVGVAALLLVGGGITLGVMFTKGRQGNGVGVLPSLVGVSASREGETWTHDDLVAHLNAHGVRCYKYPSIFGALFGPSCVLTRNPTEKPDQSDPTAACVQKRATAQAAKDAAAVTSDPSFSWGRFLFSSKDKQFLADIKKTLP